jgi:hypothetical protein
MNADDRVHVTRTGDVVVVAVLHGTVSAAEAANMLMTRSPKPERFGI